MWTVRYNSIVGSYSITESFQQWLVWIYAKNMMRTVKASEYGAQSPIVRGEFNKFPDFFCTGI